MDKAEEHDPVGPLMRLKAPALAAVSLARLPAENASARKFKVLSNNHSLLSHPLASATAVGT